MDTQDLERPLMNSGVRSVNFFNGRLLTASDLRREQEARRSVDGWLGQAVGDGVAWGLEVSKQVDSTTQQPLVTVAAGLAVNRQGQALCLSTPTTLALVRKARLAAVDDATFSQCGNLQTGTYVAGPGIYLLTIAPANTSEGKVPTNGLDRYGGQCNTDTVVETVQFRLISLEAEFAGLDFSNENKLRNQVAYRCFGADELAGYCADPLATDAGRYGALDALSDKVLTPCDVPLAMIYWTLTGGIRFVDIWSVRRKVTPREGSDWGWLINARRRSEGQAMFLQFQAHLGDLLDSQAIPANLRACEHFRWLPPAGVLPIAGPRNRGVSATTFFRDMTVRFPRPPLFAADAGPVFMEGARLPALLHEATAYPPLDASGSEALCLYRVRENSYARDQGASAAAVMVFASSQLPYYASPRFDVSRCNYANYSSAQFCPGGI